VTTSLAWLMPLLAGVLLARSSSRVAALLPPWVAVPIVTLAALLTAVATGFVLAVTAFAAAAAIPAVARVAMWSPDVSVGAPPLWLGVTAGVIVAWLAAAALRRVVTAGWSMAGASLACHRLPGADRLVVIEDDRPDAFAVQGLPGLPGRTVVSTGMLRALTTPQRRVLLAHEDAHLRGHHQLYIQVTELAAAANPLLRPAVATVRDGVERWADEVAAREVGDRTLVAKALAHAAIAKSMRPFARTGRWRAVLEMDGGPVVARARALLAPAPRTRWLLAAAFAGIALSPALSAVGVGHAAESHFEQAHAECVAVSTSGCAPRG
jgi:hypothetical protein